MECWNFKEKLRKHGAKRFLKMWNWDNDEHGDRFFSIPLFIRKNIFLHIVNDISFHGEYNAYIRKTFCHVLSYSQ